MLGQKVRNNEGLFNPHSRSSSASSWACGEGINTIDWASMGSRSYTTRKRFNTAGRGVGSSRAHNWHGTVSTTLNGLSYSCLSRVGGCRKTCWRRRWWYLDLGKGIQGVRLRASYQKGILKLTNNTVPFPSFS